VFPSDWPVIVEWNEPDVAQLMLDVWLRAAGVTRESIEDQLRCDISRSRDGIQRFRYRVSPDVLALVGTGARDLERWL